MANEFTNMAKEAAEERRKKKEEEKVVIGDQEIRVLPESIVWKWISAVFIGTLVLFGFMEGFILLSRVLLGITKSVPFFNSLLAVLAPFEGIALAVLLVVGLLELSLYLWKLKPPRFDRWVKDIAKRQLNCKYIFFHGKTLFMHYDVNLNKKDIMDFVDSINAKSEHFTYYFNNIDIDSYTVAIDIDKRKEIPGRCSLNSAVVDKTWNLFPLGLAVNHEVRDITPIGWYINSNNEDSGFVQTLVSNSILIAGGTGSGKSVVENGIIGHITRFPDHFMGLLCDVKMVEFNKLDECKGIKRVALTIDDVAELLEQAQRIMMSRFEFCTQQGANNIYSVSGVEVPWYRIGDKSYQFDELMLAKRADDVNGQYHLMTVEQIYKWIEEGIAVDINDLSLV